MSAVHTGGPAFPVPLNPGQSWQGMAPCDGMTLRDYFAARALPGEMARWTDGHPSGWAGIAAGCYAIADAMLKAREGSAA